MGNAYVKEPILKILHVGWWTIEYKKIGGIPIHVETLMNYLHRHGCDNAYFCGGRYNLLTSSVYLKRWNKSYTRVYEVVNSPNVVCAYDSVPMHISCEPIEDLFIKVLEIERPHIIHFHELESLCASLLTIARIKRIPTVVDTHNYWYLCPQLILMDTEQKTCMDFHDGEKCVSCIVIPLNSRFGRMYGMYGGYFRNTALGRALEPVAIKLYKTINKWRFSLFNTTKPQMEWPSLLFRIRRRIFVDELNKASCMIFPSNRVREVYAHHCVRNPNSVVMPPINLNYMKIKRKVSGLSCNSGRIVFGYIGRIVREKGIHVIVDAVQKLKDYKDKFRVVIFGGGDEFYLSQCIEQAKEDVVRSNVIFKGRYSPDEINDVLSCIDIGIVPSLCEETAGIVVNEFKISGTPVIASRIGGFSESVVHGVNGFLFEPGNAEELAGFMKYFIENPDEITNFANRTYYHFDIDSYTDDIIDLYRNLLMKSS